MPVKVSSFKVEDDIFGKAAQHKKYKKTGFYPVILFLLMERKWGNTGNFPYINNDILRAVSNIYN